MGMRGGAKNLRPSPTAKPAPILKRLTMARQAVRRRVSSIEEALATRLPDWFIAVRNWRRIHGQMPNILRPITFNEKILHRIIFDRRALLTQFADKAAVRIQRRELTSYAKERQTLKRRVEELLLTLENVRLG